MQTFTRTANQVSQSQHNHDRMRRAETWHRRSEKANSPAERFIFLWIAFNAAYGSEVVTFDLTDRPREAEQFNSFLNEVTRRDEDGELEKVLFCKSGTLISSLVQNKYVYRPFWNAVAEVPSRAGWNTRFNRENKEVFRAIKRRNTNKVLKVVFSRLYTLRNQIFHGGATFGAGWGSDQVRDGSQILASLVPAILRIMQRDIEQNLNSNVWGRVQYPRINYKPD